MKKVLILLAHPRLESYNAAIAEAYAEAALEHAEVKRLDLARLEFASDVARAPDYDNKTEDIEASLKEAQDLISWADHLVFIYPTFWGDMPALLKAFIDRAFIPNFAFKYQKNSPMPEQLLKGKSARIISTMDAPVLWYQLVYRAPGSNALKRAVLSFCGVKPIKVNLIGRMRYLKPEQRKAWLKRVKTFARHDLKGHRISKTSRQLGSVR